MAQASTLYRFRIDLSNIDQGVYEKLDLRTAMHPSETLDFLITRVLAYALNAQEGLQFASGGLSDPDEPALQIKDPDGTVPLWIEIGNPSARRLHKATKAARKVRVYTYKDPELLIKEARLAQVHRLEEVDLFSFAARFLNEVAEHLARDNSWTLIVNEGALMITVGESAVEGELRHHFLG